MTSRSSRPSPPPVRPRVVSVDSEPRSITVLNPRPDLHQAAQSLADALGGHRFHSNTGRALELLFKTAGISGSVARDAYEFMRQRGIVHQTANLADGITDIARFDCLEAPVLGAARRRKPARGRLDLGFALTETGDNDELDTQAPTDEDETDLDEVIAAVTTGVSVGADEGPADSAKPKEPKMKDSERRARLLAEINAAHARGEDGLVIDVSSTDRLCTLLHLLRKNGRPADQLRDFIVGEERRGNLLFERRGNTIIVLEYQLSVAVGAAAAPAAAATRKPAPQPALAGTGASSEITPTSPRRVRKSREVAYAETAQWLFDQGGLVGPEVSANALGEVLGCSGINANSILLAMVERGYIERKMRNPRRQLSIELLEAGHQLIGQTKPASVLGSAAEDGEVADPADPPPVSETVDENEVELAAADAPTEPEAVEGTPEPEPSSAGVPDDDTTNVVPILRAVAAEPEPLTADEVLTWYDTITIERGPTTTKHLANFVEVLRSKKSPPGAKVYYTGKLAEALGELNPPTPNAATA